MNASDIVAVIGPADEATIAEIVATGATFEELSEAWAWVNNEEALINQGRHLPTGKVAELCALLTFEEDEDEQR